MCKHITARQRQRAHLLGFASQRDRSSLAAAAKKGTPGAAGVRARARVARTRVGGRGTWVLIFPRGDVYVAALTLALSTQGARRFISTRCVRQAAGAQDITVCCMQRETARMRRAARRPARSSYAASDGRHATRGYVEPRHARFTPAACQDAAGSMPAVA
jgi:hypothetical protein